MRNIDHMKTFLAIFIVSLCLTLFIGNVQASSWTKVSIPNDVSIVALDMVNSSDGWAAGSNGTILHWDGKSWKTVPSPTTADFKDVEMVSSNEGYAIVVEDIAWGPYSIYRWDGTSWEYITSPVLSNKHLFSVDMINSVDGWAVGSDGVIIHWDGTSWSNVTSPTAAWLNSVDMISSTEGWILGADGIYRLQEEKETSNVPIEYLLVICTVIAVVVVWFFIKKRNLK